MYFEDIELGYKSWGEGRCKGKGLAKVGVKCFCIWSTLGFHNYCNLLISVCSHTTSHFLAHFIILK